MFVQSNSVTSFLICCGANAANTGGELAQFLRFLF